MSTHLILNENWSEYDDRKKRGGSDHRNFACTETWEVDYLAELIHKRHPHITKDRIKTAIDECCKQIAAPRPRPAFVACVIKRLGIA